MPRFARNMVILAEAETTYSTDPTPTGAANAILISNPNVVPIQANNVPRDLVRQYFGNSEELVGTKTVQMSFDVEFVGSGTLGVVPAWAPLLEACAMDGTNEVGVRHDFLPVTDSQASIYIYIYDSGVLHKLAGGRGNAVFKLNAGEKPVISFTFTGLYAPISAEALPSTDYSDFITPKVPTDANTDELTLGATLNTTLAPEFTGGTAVPSLGLEIDLGNSVQFTPLIGGETVDVTQRGVTGRVRMDLTAAQEVSRMTDVLNATLSSVGIMHDSGAGRRVALFLPSVQFINPTKEDLNGRRLIGYELRGVPNPAGSGNDELRVVTSF
jgi:hypothetical protein